MPRTQSGRIALLALLAVILAALLLPPGVDWRDTYRPAALALLSGRSPYTVDTFFAAPWSLLPLLPFALLPEGLGRAALFAASVLALAFTAHRLGAKPLTLAAFLLSPPVMAGLLSADIEWLALLGFALPPQVGLFFVLVKPEIGLAVALFWLFESWRAGGLREVTRVFGPAALAFVVTLVAFGAWTLRWQNALHLNLAYNTSLFPGSLPVGAALLVAAVRTRRLELAIGASPCLSPYVLFQAWAGALIALVSTKVEMLVAVIGLWLLALARPLLG